jgi:pyruvate kinase
MHLPSSSPGGRPGVLVMLDDGLLQWTVVGTEADTVGTRVDEGGLLGEH